MTTFQAGANGSNLLSAFLILSTISKETFSKTVLDATYANGMRSLLTGSFTVNSSGTGVTGGTLTGWTIYNADGSLDCSITGFKVDVATILNGTFSGSTILTSGLTYYGSANAKATDDLIGQGNDTFVGGAATEIFQPAAGTNSVTGGTGHTTVQFLSALSSYSIVNNNGALTVTDSVSSRNGIDHISGVQTLKFTDISVTVGSDGKLDFPTTTASQAVTWSAVGDAAAIAIHDYASSVTASLTGLETMAGKGLLGAITLYDSNPTLSLTPAQLTTDSAALQAITTTGVTAKIDASAANLTLTGISSLANVAVFSGTTSEYSVTDTNGIVTVTDTSTGRTSVDHLTGFTALQFSDHTVFVAATPGAANAVTTGNITELYSAALAREPDASGLTFYQNFLKTNPSTSLTSFAQFFLSSTEYTSNTAHNYAQTTAGETQFVTDLYTNLLHRTPDSGAVPFYLNVITGLLSHDKAGTAQYTADDKAAHALVLTYLSQSPEFLSDVQITAQNSASAQHWLVLG